MSAKRTKAEGLQRTTQVRSAKKVPPAKAAAPVCCKRGKHSAAKSHAPSVPRILPQAPAPARVRQFIRQQLAAHLPEICDGLLQLARDGDMAAIKILLQMAEPARGKAKVTGTAMGLTEKQLGFARKTLAELRGQ